MPLRYEINKNHSVRTLLVVAALVIAPFASVQPVSAATLNWDGSAGDGKFSTAANWNTNTVPVSGDVIALFPATAGHDYQPITLDNDLSGVSFAGILLYGSESGYTTNYSLNRISFTAGATIEDRGNSPKKTYLSFGQDSVITAAGNYTNLSRYAYNYGTVNAVGGAVSANYLTLGPNSNIGEDVSASGLYMDSSAVVGGSIILPEGENAVWVSGASGTISADFVVNDFNHSMFLNQMGFGRCTQELGSGAGGGGAIPVAVGCAAYGAATYTLSGAITLNSDLIIHIAESSTVNIIGEIAYNGHSILLEPSSKGSLNIGGDTSGGGSPVVARDTEKSYDGAQETIDITIPARETATLNGTRGEVIVSAGGLLKGTGVAKTLYVNSGGVLAPGNSPGSITVLQNLYISGTYSAELLNNGSYDSVVAGESYPYGDSGSAVALSSQDAVLEIVLYDGWKIGKNDTYVLINNRSSTPVYGVFKGMPEGAQFMVSDGSTSVPFTISYIGGDGNDIVITALSAAADPTPPNTGVARIVMANPLLVAAMGLVSAVLMVVAIRSRKVSSNR